MQFEAFCVKYTYKMCYFSVSFCLYLESVVIKEIIYFTYLSPNTNTIITY